MVLKSTPGANIPTYQVAGTNASRIIPDWLIKKRKKTLKYDPEFANRLELIQDFHFEEASNRIKVTRDGQFCMATGTYKPQIHVYDFNELSLKFDRHTDAENIDFCLISDDWTKSIHLQNDRSIEFHAQGGIHHRTRIPKFGRAMAYNPSTCDIIVGASSNEVYRLNIDQGRFMAPFECESDGVNALDINPAHGLMSFGMENGTVEFWDPRTRQRAALIDVSGNDQSVLGGGITAVKFRQDGLNFAAGTFEGNTMLFDLRSPEPLMTKDQGYGFAIKNIEWLDTRAVSDKVLVSDKRIVKIWDRNNGEAFTSFEPSVDINDVAVVPDSGMIFLANEGSPMHAYYIPAIGPAPKWCSYLDNVTEENEEKGETSVYENFKFVTKKELQQLNLGHLIGSNVVKSYMHGYFINKELYDKARSIANPFAYREHREREIKRKIDKQRESRIRTAGAAGSKVKVNKGLAAEAALGTGESNLLADDRFKDLFENPEFQIDESNREFATKVKSSEQAEVYNAGKRGLTAVEQEELSDGLSADESSDDEDDTGKSQKQLQQEKKLKQQKERRERQLAQKKQMLQQQQSLPQMRAVVGTNKTGGGKSFGDQIDDNADFDQWQQEEEATTRKSANGSVEISYIPASTKKKMAAAKKEQQAEEEEAGAKDSGRKKQRHGGIRRASKNTFRNM